MFFPWIFLQFGLGGAGVQIVETRIFLRGTVMKASSHEKHSKQQWKKQKKNQTHGQGLGRGLAGYMGLNCFFFCFLVFPWFFAVWPKPQEHQKKTKKKSDPWARSGLSTHKPKNQKNKKPRNQKTKKTKNQKNKKYKKNKKTRPNTLHLTPSPWGVQSCFFLFFWFFGFLFFWCFGLCVESTDLAHGSELFVFFFFVLEVLAKLQKSMEKPKKPKNQDTKKPKKTKKKKNKIAHPKGRGSDAECWVLSFCFFVFLFFWFFVFLVWIAIADVPSRDCQALSVVALEARSIHYSTAMFAMT